MNRETTGNDNRLLETVLKSSDIPLVMLIYFLIEEKNLTLEKALAVLIFSIGLDKTLCEANYFHHYDHKPNCQPLPSCFRWPARKIAGPGILGGINPFDQDPGLALTS